MANYTITKFKAIETIGDSIFHNNMVTSGTLTITPSKNYVVTASDFSVPNLPSNISSVTFADTGVAGQPENTVIVTANLASSFVLTANTKIVLNISGNAKIWNPNIATVDVNITMLDNANENYLGSSTIEAADGYTANTTLTENLFTGKVQINETVITGQVIKNKLTKIATLNVTAH